MRGTQVRFHGAHELLLLGEYGTYLRVNGGIELWIVGWRRRRGTLMRDERVGQLTQRVEGRAFDPLQIGALVGGGRMGLGLLHQLQSSGGLLGLHRQSSALAQVGDLHRRSVTREVAERQLESFRHQAELGK